MAAENRPNPVDKTGDARVTPGYIAGVKARPRRAFPEPGAGADMV
jgi:hypothetical protein